MKNTYSVVCGKYRKRKKPKVLYVFLKKLVLPFTCSKCGKKSPAGKYWFPGRPEDVPLQRPQDVR